MREREVRQMHTTVTIDQPGQPKKILKFDADTDEDGFVIGWTQKAVNGVAMAVLAECIPPVHQMIVDAINERANVVEVPVPDAAALQAFLTSLERFAL
jgi:hypothetical protein